MASTELENLINALLERRRQSPSPSLEEQREGWEQWSRLFPAASDLRVEPSDADGVGCEWVVAPDADSGRAILYLHGGGYVIGSLNTHRDLAGRLSRAAAARILMVDYRLAPENPHPAALEDALTAYRWLTQQGVEHHRLAVAGDSAGGGLTVATLVALRDAGEALPAAAACLSPWIDLECEGATIQSKAHSDPVLQPDQLRTWGRWYAGEPDNLRAPLVSPVHADLQGLPPLLIHVGGREILLDDAQRLADRARAAGVEVELECWEEMIHIWHSFAPLLPEGQRAIERVGAFLRSRTA